jgi:uncharacterized membrane protein
MEEKTSTPILSRILQGGVILSATLIGLGLALFLLTGQSGYSSDNNGAGSNTSTAYINYQQTESNQVYFPVIPVEIWHGALSLKPFALIMLGMLMLIATPVLNVAIATISSIHKQDWAFSLIGGFVLLVLILSFFLSKAIG